jgi:hypothetical protein
VHQKIGEFVAVAYTRQLRMRYTWHLRMSLYSLYFQDADMHRFSATNQAHDARTSFRFG